MMDNFDLQDDFYDDELNFSKPHLSLLNANDDFSLNVEEKYDFDSMLDDEEFDRLLKKILEDEDLNENQEPLNDNVTLDDERRAFEAEKKIALDKIRIEREELEHEKAKFARTKKEWEALKKLSEESFQAEKLEYEKQKELDREKMYLETRELINSCANFREFFEDYKKIHDVSE